jgi:hypothetical protein
MNSEYRFINHRPGRYRMRNGKLGKSERSREEWRIALAGHVENAHRGFEQASCAGCRELRQKAEASDEMDHLQAARA